MDLESAFTRHQRLRQGAQELEENPRLGLEVVFHPGILQLHLQRDLPGCSSKRKDLERGESHCVKTLDKQLLHVKSDS